MKVTFVYYYISHVCLCHFIDAVSLLQCTSHYVRFISGPVALCVCYICLCKHHRFHSEK
jgi:hypothetical protein